MAGSTVQPEGLYDNPPRHYEPSKGGLNRKRVYWCFALLAVLIVILLAAVIVFIILFEVKDFGNSDDKSSSTWSTAESSRSERTVPPDTSTAAPATAIPPEQCKELRQCSRKFDKPPLLVISFDGFRNAYLDLKITPTIQKVFDCGTHSKFMIPSFPSKTFPNHYAIATGLYPAWHGIVDNSFRDPTVPGENFTQATKANGWYLGEPIWNTVQRAGLKSAVYFWPGSEAPDHYPTYYEVYDKTVPYIERADQIIRWLSMSEDERPQLLHLYMEEPDGGGHKGGPGSQEVRAGMLVMDSILNYLIQRLVTEGFMGCINMILLSDHGMQFIDYNRAVLMDSYLPADFHEILYTGVVAHLAVTHNDTNVDALVEKMKCMNGTDFILYKTKQTPSRFHYGGSSRNGDVVIQGRKGVYIMSNEQMKEDNLAWHGNHGFDNRIVEMRAIFGAIGPSIAENREIAEFENIELYGLFADLLEVDPAPNNGTKGHLYSVLKYPPAYVETVAIVENRQCVQSVQITSCDAANCPDVNKMFGSCSLDTSTVQFEISNGGECQLQLCDAVIHYNDIFKKVQIIETTISPEDWETTSSTCTSVITDLSGSCPQTPNDDYISLFINKVGYNTLDIGKVLVPQGFKNGTWKYLVNTITQYVHFHGKMSMYAGVGYDSNGDSVRDGNTEITTAAGPTHIVVVLLKCVGNPGADRHNCRNPTTITFILPILESDFNCLPPSQYLWQNTGRIRDVEIMSGTHFFRDRNVWTTAEAIALRTRVLQELWAPLNGSSSL